MAIQIRQRLEASPNPTSLPRRIEFRQTLRSNRAAETITVVYSMDAAHNVWFQDGTNPLTKSITRQETVGRDDKVCLDRVMVEEGPGQGPMDVVQVDQAITDASGVTIGDTCLLQITR